MLTLTNRLTVNSDLISAPNLCDRFTPEDLKTISSHVWQGYQADKQSRSAWERRMSAAQDLAMQISKDKNFPWPGASNVIFPLVTIASLQFSARAYPAIIPGTDVVKYRVLGNDPKGEVKSRADRIARHMSWQVLEEDEAWEEQHDRLLINLAVIGSAFIKTFFDGGVGHNVSELVMARDLVTNYYSKSISSSPRKTHLIPLTRNEIWERVEDDIYSKHIRSEAWFHEPPSQLTSAPDQRQVDVRRGMNPPPVRDPDSSYMMLEQHCYFDFDGDGYAEPYTVTIEEGSKATCRIVARFEESGVDYNRSGRVRKIKSEEYFTKYSFIPSPDGGIYDLGFGAFLGPINEAVSSSINQLIDSGTFQNSIGGFLGRGAKIRGGIYSMAPWEWKRVDSTGDDLRKNLVPFPDRQPLTVTLQLIELLITYADRLAGTTETMVGENPGQNTPAETSRNMTEQGMKVYSMIFKRVWRSMKEEFKKLYKLNKVYLTTHKSFGDGNDFIQREDYSGNADQIAPVADPNITSTTMQVYQASAVREAALTTPGYDREEAQKRWLKAMKVDNVETLYLGEEKAKPLPNPKMAQEQLKLEGHKMKIEADKIKWANELLAEHPKIQAEIDLIKAQAAKLIAEIGADKASAQLDAFEVAIKGFETYHSAITNRIKALTQGKSDEEGTGNSKPGNVPGLAAPPGDAGIQGAPPSMGGGPGGPVEGGGVPV